MRSPGPPGLEISSNLENSPEVLSWCTSDLSRVLDEMLRVCFSLFIFYFFALGICDWVQAVLAGLHGIQMNSKGALLPGAVKITL